MNPSTLFISPLDNVFGYPLLAAGRKAQSFAARHARPDIEHLPAARLASTNP